MNAAAKVLEMLRVKLEKGAGSRDIQTELFRIVSLIFNAQAKSLHCFYPSLFLFFQNFFFSS